MKTTLITLTIIALLTGCAHHEKIPGSVEVPGIARVEIDPVVKGAASGDRYQQTVLFARWINFLLSLGKVDTVYLGVPEDEPEGGK